jgi:protein-S-isoprenylcysteine O-methyltransferase Ste14
VVSWSGVARRIRVPLGFSFAVVYLWLAHPAWYSLLAGGVIALAGLALRAAASGHVRKNAALTTTGPYAYTRNPLYLGSIIIAAGFAVAARSAWIAAILALMFLLVYVPVIRSEEHFLRAQFPEYETYARQVPRFGPRLSTVQAGNGRFARELYLKHREYNALIGAVAMMAALVAKLVWLGSR